MKYLNFLIGFSLICFTLIFCNCSKESKIIEKDIDFVAVRKMHSEDTDSPYFFGSILDICANSKYIYVSDWKTYSIKVFDHDFTFIKKIGEKGGGPGEFDQIFVSMICDEERLYLLTINRLHIFTAEGEFEKKIILRFIPRRVFLTDEKIVFKNDSSDKVFTITDFDGKIIDEFFKNKVINSKECGKTYAPPEAYLSSMGDLFVMDSTQYSIEVVNMKTRKSKKLIRTHHDFWERRCERSNSGGYFMVGGHSWILESRKYFYYFYYSLKKEMKIDLFDKSKLTLEITMRYSGDFRPRLIHPKEEKFIGYIPDQSDVLYLCILNESVHGACK